jgi:hypothetical protein
LNEVDPAPQDPLEQLRRILAARSRLEDEIQP